MDRRTVAAYEQGARSYAERRRAYHPERAARFAADVRRGARRLDLGSGPGHYLPHLGEPVVALDAAFAMLVEARDRTGGAATCVVGDLAALPFRGHGFAGAWACKSLQHVAAAALPLALADLHRVLEVDGVLDVTLFAGEGTLVTRDDDFPGRMFTLWSPGELRRVLIGAGFEVTSLEVVDSDAELPRLTATARRARTLADTVGPDMALLVCGLNPSLYAADAGVGFARPGNRFWPAARAAGVVSVDRDPQAALRRDGVGMTDLVKRATTAASELRPDEYRAGLDRVERLVEWLAPGAVCFVGLAGWRAAVDRRARPGVQPTTLGGRPVYVMPSTSGLNTHASAAALTEHLRAARDLTA